MASFAALLEEARKLSDEDRWALGRALLEDLDDEPFWADPEVEEAWMKELQRRSALIDSGQATLIDADVALERIFGRPRP